MSDLLRQHGAHDEAQEVFLSAEWHTLCCADRVFEAKFAPIMPIFKQKTAILGHFF